MIRWERLNPNERLIVESPVNRYKIAGPGWVTLTLRQKIVTRLYVGPRGHSFQFKEVRTAENIPVDVKVQVIYRVDPSLLADELLSRTAGLNDGGWHGSVQWQTEYVLRMLVAQYPWRELNREEVQKRLERHVTQTLADRLKRIGLDIFTVCLVKTELPDGLQKTLLQAEKDTIEAQGRASVLKSYFEIFGASLPTAMPYIVQWELMNTIHKNGDPTVLLTNENLSAQPQLPMNGITRPPVFHMQLPLQ